MKPTEAKVIIMLDGPEAAEYRADIAGWVSRGGQFFGSNESAARYDGCTHVACKKCGAPTEKGYTVCNGCRDLADNARFLALPEAEWDGEAPLYSKAMDEYYSDPSGAYDRLEDWHFGDDDAHIEPTVDDLRLLICRPVYVRQLDEEWCGDDIGEDAELPAAVLEAIAAFNKAVAGIVISWEPGKTRLKVSES